MVGAIPNSVMINDPEKNGITKDIIMTEGKDINKPMPTAIICRRLSPFIFNIP